jgi:hypothetical protein
MVIIYEKLKIAKEKSRKCRYPLYRRMSGPQNRSG